MTIAITETTEIVEDTGWTPGTGPTLELSAPSITLTIRPDVTVSSPDDEVIVSDNEGVSVINHGTIFSTQPTGILGALAFGGEDSSLTNKADGQIVSTSNGVAALGDGMTLTNRGAIQSAEGAGIISFPSNGTTVVNTGEVNGHIGVYLRGGDIENAGTIAGEFGIETTRGGLAKIENASDGLIHGTKQAISAILDGRVNLDNRGEVDGDIVLIGADQRDVITNRGDIDGVVKLGSGNDKYKGIGNSGTGNVFGESGDDLLIGGHSREKLNGGDGKDTLQGGRGKDILIGGSEEDVFDFGSLKDSVKGSKRDKINDFARGEDLIDLSDIDAKTGVGGDQKFKWIGKNDFHDKKGELRYEDKGSKVIVQGDVDGNGKADFEIFVNVGKLGSDDFVF